MQKKTILWIAFLFSLAGFLFAGYLTFSKIALGVCPLLEPCPIFFGQPACFYGFILYTILLIISGFLLFKKNVQEKKLVPWLLGVSAFGIIFAISSTIKEVFLSSCPGGKCVYSLGLPTCIYGLIMYCVIFFSSLKLRKQ